MDIIFCTDKNYIKLLPTVLNSISAHNQMEKIQFHLLHDIKNQNIVDSYKTYVSRKHKSKLTTYFISRKIGTKNNLTHVTDATMLRLLIPSVVNTRGRVLYLDLDIIVNVNLQNVLSLDPGPKGISGKTSVCENVIENMSFGTIRPTYKTLNAGVLVMDLEVLRKNKFTEKCLELVHKYPYNDQVIINLYLKGRYPELPKQYNIFNTQDDNILFDNKNFILHYIGAYKPWDNTVPHANIWKKFEVYNLDQVM